MMRPGLFLSLDGIDGTGKSTQCRLLADWLTERGIPNQICHDPGGTPLGDQLRAVLLDRRQEMTLRAEALLFMASRAELVARTIRPALETGKVVIADRFLLANIVYQGHAGGLDPESLRQVGNFSTDGLEPDLTLVLDLPIEEAARRRGRDPDRMEAKDAAYRERVRQGFLTEARRLPERFRIIDASASVDVIQAQLRQEMERLL